MVLPRPAAVAFLSSAVLAAGAAVAAGPFSGAGAVAVLSEVAPGAAVG